MPRFAAPVIVEGADGAGLSPLTIRRDGSDVLRTLSNGLDDPAYFSRLTDDFCIGGTTTGNVGGLRWNIGGSPTITLAGGAANHVGSIRITTPATLNASCGLYLGDSTNFMVSYEDDFDLLWVLALEQTANIGLSFGLANPSTGTNIFVANGVYWNKGTGASTWSARCSKASAISTANFDTQDTSWHAFRMRKIPGQEVAGFTFDGGTENLVTTNFPLVNLNPFVCIQTTEAVAKSVRIDLFDMTVSLFRG